MVPLDVFFQVIEDPFVKAVKPEPRMINVVQREDWRALIMAYLHRHYEPNTSSVDQNATESKSVSRNWRRTLRDISYMTTASLFKQR
jgi:hypothetical protein